MFLLTVNGTGVSQTGPSDPATYNPVYLELDSTDVDPAPSPWVSCLLSLPAGYVSKKDASGTSGGVLIRFEGTTANQWQITGDNPAIVALLTIGSELRLNVDNNIPTEFWVRGSTTYGEVPIDDRSVAIKVSGQVEKVA